MATCNFCMGVGSITVLDETSECAECDGTGQVKVDPRPAAKPERCIVPNCGNVRSARGLCGKCYSEANHAIKRKETSWKELTELGLAYGKDTPFIKALRKARDSKPQDTQ